MDRGKTAFVRWPLMIAAGFAIFCCAPSIRAQIPQPDDAPQPLSPEDSARCFRVPAGFRVELVASEPLVREPSGVCWDERGQFFVCELHGYNLEGQYDIEELNRTGELDRVVRRIQADERHKAAAEAETYGTIKQLIDDDGDGRMDRAVVFADRIPPCLGICPARDGLIAACQTQILFLADRDNDGTAEIRDVLFEGFEQGPLERSINCPQWGHDNWIWFGCGAGGGTITGKNLSQPVTLPRTDFRIRADGSRIEPVVGATGTMGFAFTGGGDRFVISTRAPGIFVAPVCWEDLARNPHVPTPRLERSATSDQRTFPASDPHPWRTRRADDPEFSRFYSDRYGIEESQPNGFFTSACSPLIYRDSALPGLHGQLLACEPAQNMVHRAIVMRDGTRLTLHRHPDEQQSEFLTSTDPWFHAISLAHAPDGSILIVDFYREIIEDYSAIPRYLQQQYGLIGGRDHGRLWRLTHDDLDQQPTASADMTEFTTKQLFAEVVSPRFWRRETARRILQNRREGILQSDVAPLMKAADNADRRTNLLQAMREVGVLGQDDIERSLQHPDPEIRRHAITMAESYLRDGGSLAEAVLGMVSDESPVVRLQVALSLGYGDHTQAVPALLQLATEHGDEPWMSAAILSSVATRSGDLLQRLLELPEFPHRADGLIEPLCRTVAGRGHRPELTECVRRIASVRDPRLRLLCIRGLRSGLNQAYGLDLGQATRRAFQEMAVSSDDQLREQAMPLLQLLKLESEDEYRDRIFHAQRNVQDVTLPTAQRVAAVYQLAEESRVTVMPALMSALESATPQLQDALLSVILSDSDRITRLLDAIQRDELPQSLLTSVQRAALRESSDDRIRKLANDVLQPAAIPDPEQFSAYAAALEAPRDVAHGREVFRSKCGPCHRAHGIGHAVGPDLSAEFLRAEETMIRDVLLPNETLSSGYRTYTVVTTAGRVSTGLLAAESPTSITLRQAEAKEDVVLRKDMEALRLMRVSLMPDDLTKLVSPRDLADVIAWLRQPPQRLVLLDEDPGFALSLDQGSGSAEFVSGDAFAGQLSLRIRPFQRYSARIPGWEFPIRENPGPGQYRYLQLAWKVDDAQGVLIELAADGDWPPAEQPLRRYHAGRNSSDWHSVQVDPAAPREWQVITRDLWKDFGDFTLTGIAPTALGGTVHFDRLELLQVDDSTADADPANP